ncbi:MAG: GNAT family N-acetyltransferase [Patescibacteria group bacterium]
MEQIDFLKLADLDDLKRIDDLAFPQDAEGREIYEDRIKTFPAGCYKITLEGKMVGFLSSELWSEYHPTILNRKASLFHDPVGKIVFVSALGIMPGYQGKGLGSRLLKMFIQKMKNDNRTSIYLRSANKARPFYEKHGFTFVKQEEDNGTLNDILELKL